MALIIKNRIKDPLQQSSKSKNLDGVKVGTRTVSDSEKAQKPKKMSFLSSTICELKRVEWPTFKQTMSWAAVTIVFTIMISLTLGFFDHVFAAGINFIDCTSPRGRGESTTIAQCGRELADYLTFRN